MQKERIVGSVVTFMIATMVYSQTNVYSKGYDGELDKREIKEDFYGIGVASKSAVFEIEERDKPKTNYMNLGITLSQINQRGVSSLKNYGGVCWSIGKTFYVDGVRISDNVLFGIDATWLDFNFAVQVGPSFTYSPTYDVDIHGYCRYAPSYSLLLLGHESYSSLGHFVVFGLNVSYRAIGLGLEGRLGSSKYHNWVDQEAGLVSEKIKTSALRIYLAFMF